MLLLALGCGSEQLASAPIGDSFVTVNEAKRHVRRIGETGPSVVLESALGGTVADWDLVADALGGFTRVLAYDRLGLGSSDAGPEPRSAGAMADELHALLRESGLPAPYVLCGHSLGGLIVELYADRYPEDVCGLVLVDPSTESFFREMDELGLDSVRNIDTKGWPEGPRAEVAAWDLTLAEVRAGPPAPAIPCEMLISAMHGMDPATENLWIATHIEWARSHPPATYKIDREHGHYLQRENPDLVIQAVWHVAAHSGQPVR